MRAIEYGLLHYKQYAFKNEPHNLFVFNHEIVDEAIAQEEPSSQENRYHQVTYNEPNFNLIENGETMEPLEVNYLFNTQVTQVEDLGTQNVYYNGPFSTPAPVVKINENYFALLTTQDADDIGFSVLHNEVSIEVTSLKKPKRSLLTILDSAFKQKEMALVVFVSSDGALLETAYQSIDELYPNEMVMFVETNDKNNFFGSVVRVKTGDNITESSEIPYKLVAKVLNHFFKTDISIAAIQEIVKEHVEEKSGMLYFVKRRIWLFGSKIMSISTEFTYGIVGNIATEISGWCDSLHLSDKNWQYYDDEGLPIKKPELFLPILPAIALLQTSDKENALSLKKINAPALLIIEELENKIENSRKNLGKIKWMRNLLDPILPLLTKVKDFLKSDLPELSKLAQDVLVMYNAFIVGLINSLVDAVKGFFDLIALMCEALENLSSKALNVANNLSSYFSLFLETLENMGEMLTNLTSKENIKALLVFFLKCTTLVLALPFRIFEGITNSKMPNNDALAYYLGYTVGFVVQLIIETILTGGTKAVASAFSKIGQSFQEVVSGAKKLMPKAIGKAPSIETLLSFFSYLREKSKNLKFFLEELWEIIQGWFKKGKIDEVEGLRKLAYDDFVRTISKANIDEIIQHLFEGDFGITRRGRRKFFSAKGMHSMFGVNKKLIRIIEDTEIPPKLHHGPDTFFKAKPQLKYKNGQWIDKMDNGGYSSFFPSSWTKDRIMEEIAFAWKNRNLIDEVKGLYRGFTSTGQELIICIKNGEIKTVFPKLD
ncbi:hypothetical protein GV828_12835 [Flavobacterium sp. NST-5]|uniref:Bacterial EndoU nuclease domain-containing protein n=1 Tax=Flavobacterium ichthyis TaxID=2698827 RepID=A0ABW9ZBI6_9FLAO|nr:EndoU domain-containing protein [Flavobacterium ichthyis]NBL66084.1 hypothetical protein [Flavobacterium ichthyis]